VFFPCSQPIIVYVDNKQALVVKISEKGRKSHLVAIVKGEGFVCFGFRCCVIPFQVPDAEDAGLSSPWFLFNDFVVTNISQKEALSFPDKWKVQMLLHPSFSLNHHGFFPLSSLPLFIWNGLIFETSSI